VVDMHSARECMPASFDIGPSLLALSKCCNTQVRLCSERRGNLAVKSDLRNSFASNDGLRARGCNQVIL
jgi:hypothetical protein